MQDAMSRMNYLMSAIKSQLMLEATGAEIITPPELVCELAAQQWDEYGRVGSPAEWPAMLRWADDLDPSYKT
jgi:hypothetical protein